jgi:hypothetical protein
MEDPAATAEFTAAAGIQAREDGAVATAAGHTKLLEDAFAKTLSAQDANRESVALAAAGLRKQL